MGSVRRYLTCGNTSGLAARAEVGVWHVSFEYLPPRPFAIHRSIAARVLGFIKADIGNGQNIGRGAFAGSRRGDADAN